MNDDMERHIAAHKAAHKAVKNSIFAEIPIWTRQAWINGFWFGFLVGACLTGLAAYLVIS